MEVKIKSEFIKLGQLLKYVDLISTGGEEKIFLASHPVLVNGEIDQRRGRKIYPGDIVVIDQQTYLIQ